MCVKKKQLHSALHDEWFDTDSNAVVFDNDQNIEF